MTNSEIAVRLGISSRTAETHRANLMHKLDMHSQAELIRFALRRGIIPMEG
jgi:two-component system response regulator NreC